MTEDTTPKEIGTDELFQEISKGYRTFKLFEKGQEVLNGLLKLEQNIREKNVVLDALKTAEAEWNDKKARALAAVDDAGKRVEDKLAAADTDVKRIAEEARVNASKIVGDAKAQASKLVSEAKALVDKHSSTAQELAAANGKVNSLLTAGKEELAKVEGALAEHKASLTKFLNGGK